MKSLYALILALLLAGAGAPALAQPAGPESKAAPPRMTAQPTENDPVSAAREYDIAVQLRCLVCQNQSIADSNADLAVDLRRQVREQIAAGRSDREIIDFMTSRYGDFVLYKPPFKATTAVLWVGPALLLMVGGAVAWVVLRGRRGAPGGAQLTDEERARAAAMLAGEQNK